MGKIFYTTLYSTLLLSFLTTPVLAQNADSYALDVDTPNGTIHVHAKIHDIQRGEVLCLPAFGQRFGEHLITPSVVTADRATYDAHFDDAGCLHPQPLDEIHFNYTLKMDRLDGPHTWIASELSPRHDDHTLVFPGESLFIERGANNSPSTPHPTHVNVSTPEHVVSTLIQNTENSENLHPPQFTAENSFVLNRSYWVFGHFQRFIANTNHTTLQFVVDAAFKNKVDVMKREFLQILDAYAAWMPNHTPRQIAIFLFSTPFDAEYNQGFARPSGIVLELGNAAAAQTSTRRILMAHELFHLYNGEGLRFDPKQYPQTAWFREGMTQYIAFKTLLRLGLISEAQRQDWMATALERHHTRPQRDRDLAYTRGFFISLAIEQQWARFKTHFTLEKFWKNLDNSPLWSILHTNATLKKALFQYSAFHFDDFFRRYIDGKTELPFESILKLSGLCLYSSKNYRYNSGLHYRYDAQNALLRVDFVDPASAAQQAGLQKGDLIVPDANTHWRDRSDKKITLFRGTQKIHLRLPATLTPIDTLTVDRCF